MRWYKSWLETRSRFPIGLALLTLSVAGAVVAYPRVVKLLPLVPTMEASGELGRRIREGAELMRNYRGYIWSQLSARSHAVSECTRGDAKMTTLPGCLTNRLRTSVL